MLGLCIALGATSILQTSSAAALAFCIGEALWPGGGLPAALDDEGYLSALLEKSASRDPLWAERKLCAAVDAVLAIPAVVRLLRGGAAEPLLSDAALQEAGRVLRRGALYWHGFDASGGPIMWAHTGRMDLRDAEPSAWGRAVATLIEVGVVGTRARRAGEGCRVGSGVGAAVGDSDGRSEAPRCDRFVYVECADGFSLGPKVPLTRAVAVARRSLAALFGGSPERFAGAVVAPASRTNRILFSLARHFIPASTARRIHFFGQTEQLRAFFRRRELGLDSAVLPACLGGSATHAGIEAARAKAGSAG
ncbi:hypothetical protein EMIHUDRAFT_216420 [Emiliania huxleyi CCMP1516]|uniref:CRAL-TRIO domain-containing protein n=2 Tax=Emiliania huxleyi TaxID=2903 RepID=A0A0D3IEX7_EMIH1|nr:hypothetical protein EMIHUDRAFT_216420 [Emiliania huxleyi CCMP1516]EOD09812.1 hypothetical protein EMIHUDRAFT_216420 [Emiliania huxleyi CCMP1516]|eukprot:XP_005762241.1 hypothetical protein EMIHUDRAFT_216420 [Emiliania huxleyi CCMP1516]